MECAGRCGPGGGGTGQRHGRHRRGHVRRREGPQDKALAPGITYKELDVPAARGVARAHVLSVDLSNRHVRVDLLHSAAVASRAAVSRLAEAQGALAGVNGDFFDITETQHPGVEATGATVGPAIANGRVLKAAVPDGQRFGPALPPGTTTKDVLGVGLDGRARLDSLALDGSVRSSRGRWALGGSTSTRCRRVPSARSPRPGAASPGSGPPAAPTSTAPRPAARTPTR